MSNKADILGRLKAYKGKKYEMPEVHKFKGIEYPDKLVQFVSMSETVGGKVVTMEKGQDINKVIKELYPEAKVFASNVKGITIADRNPDTVAEAQDLNGTDVGIVEGVFGVAENGCIWIPQGMKEKIIYFVSEYLVIILKKDNIVNNMHEAYQRIQFNDYGYGVFISGPSKTADIAQALVMGAQAARGVTVLLVP